MSHLTTKPLKALGQALEALGGPADAHLIVGEAEMLARVSTLLGAAASHLTMDRSELLASIRNAIASGADLSALTSSDNAILADIAGVSRLTTGGAAIWDLAMTAIGGASGGGGDFAWPQAPDSTPALALADAVNGVYGVDSGATRLTVASGFADSTYVDNGGNFRTGAFNPATDIGAGGIVLAGHGPKRFAVQVPPGAILDEMIADERTILIEFEDITGSPLTPYRTTAVQFTHDASDSYTIEFDPGGDEVGVFDYGDFFVEITPTPMWNPSGINRVAITFSAGNCSFSFNGSDAVSGALDRSAEGREITGLHFSSLLNWNAALRRVVAFSAMSDADLKILTTIADPTGVLARADAGAYDFRYYEIFDGTVPLNFNYAVTAGAQRLTDWFANGNDPYLWDPSNIGNVNLTPLPGGDCVVGSGLAIPMDLSLTPAWDATIYDETLPDERQVFVVEWLETQNDVTRKAGLFSQFLQASSDSAIAGFIGDGFLQCYFEAGHIKLRAYIRNADNSAADVDVVLVGPAVSPNTVTRAAVLWDRATGDLAVSVNGGAATVGVAQASDAGHSLVVTYGKPAGFLSTPDDLSTIFGAHTASAPLGGWLRRLDTLLPTWAVADLPTLSA